MPAFLGSRKTRGLACIAIFGNVVTSWSWFGTNMLGVGLHSYGFMDKAFNYLMMFIISQMVIIGLAYIHPLFGFLKNYSRPKPPPNHICLPLLELRVSLVEWSRGFIMVFLE
jgi:hypothetical protein